METTEMSMPDSEPVRKLKDAMLKAQRAGIKIRGGRMGIGKLRDKWVAYESQVCPLGALLLGETVSPDAYEQAAEMLGVDIPWIDGFTSYFDLGVSLCSYDGQLAAIEIQRWLYEEAGTAKLTD